MKKSIIQNIVVALVTFALSWCLFSFWNPNAGARRDAVRNALVIDSLENVITRWELYTENLKRALSGEEGFTGDSLLTLTPPVPEEENGQ